jgi:hypothetical protein
MKRRHLSALVSLSAISALPACAQTAKGSAAGASAMVYECTFLRALPDQLDRLKRFIRANWFAMDALAAKQGLMSSYRLLEPRLPQGGGAVEPRDWDLLVMVGYPTSGGYADIAEAFEAIRRAHATVPIDGLGFRALGQIVRTSTWAECSEAG